MIESIQFNHFFIFFRALWKLFPFPSTRCLHPSPGLVEWAETGPQQRLPGSSPTAELPKPGGCGVEARSRWLWWWWLLLLFTLFFGWGGVMEYSMDHMDEEWLTKHLPTVNASDVVKCLKHQGSSHQFKAHLQVISSCRSVCKCDIQFERHDVLIFEHIFVVRKRKL